MREQRGEGSVALAATENITASASAAAAVAELRKFRRQQFCRQALSLSVLSPTEEEADPTVCCRSEAPFLLSLDPPHSACLSG